MIGASSNESTTATTDAETPSASEIRDKVKVNSIFYLYILIMNFPGMVTNFA